jgi:outer membrane protein
MDDRSKAGWGRALALAVVAALGMARGAAAEGRFGVVDMQRALNECDAGKKAKDQVKAKFERAQDQLKKERDDIDRSRDDYEKKAVALSEEKRRDMEKDLDNRQLDFKRKYEDFQRDLKRTDAELTSGIVEQLYAIVADYGQKQGYTMIFEVSSGALLYADKALDVTEQVVEMHNSGAYKSLSLKKDKD